MSRILGDMLGAAHVTAGALIRCAAGFGDAVETGTGSKSVPNVEHNQTLLLQGMAAYKARPRPSAHAILLDGHFSLLSPSGAVVDVAVEVFNELQPIAILLVEARTETVRRRLRERDGNAPNNATLRALALRERARAMDVQDALRVPLWSMSGEVPAEDAAATAAEQLRPLIGGPA